MDPDANLKSESGRRMLSDFVETRHLRDVLERMDTLVAPPIRGVGTRYVIIGLT